MMKSTDYVAAEKVSNHIHDDLAFFIMSKLPLKSLKRFSCVRKSWSRLFENLNFINMYRNYFISGTYEEDGSCLLLQQTLLYFPNFHHVLYLLFGERFENKVKLDWPSPFQEDNRAIHILGPVINGIVCLYQGREPVVILWNPATEEYKVLPPSPTESPVHYEQDYYYVHGFGHDHVRDDYKVIRYVEHLFVPDDFKDDMEGEPIRLLRDNVWEIYNLRSNSWRKLDLDLPRARHGWVGVYVYMKGVCHWYQDEFEPKGYLVSFDLSNEVFCTTPMPLYMNDGFDPVFLMRYMMVFNDHIALISNYVEMTTFHISILGELGVKESWTKLFVIGPLPCIAYPIGEGKNGDFFFKRIDGELIRYNLSTQVIDELGFKGEFGSCRIVNYKESPLPIGQIND